MYGPLDVVILGLFGTIGPYFLGWLVFRLIANQNNPFKRPDKISERPKWFIAFWTGAAIAGVLAMAISGVERSDILGRVVLKSAFFLIFLIPGLIGYWIYKRKVKKSVKPIVRNYDKSFEPHPVKQDYLQAQSQPQKTNWYRRLNIVFVTLWVLLALIVLVVLPYSNSVTHEDRARLHHATQVRELRSLDEGEDYLLRLREVNQKLETDLSRASLVGQYRSIARQSNEYIYFLIILPILLYAILFAVGQGHAKNPKLTKEVLAFLVICLILTVAGREIAESLHYGGRERIFIYGLAPTLLFAALVFTYSVFGRHLAASSTTTFTKLLLLSISTVLIFSAGWLVNEMKINSSDECIINLAKHANSKLAFTSGRDYCRKLYGY